MYNLQFYSIQPNIRTNKTFSYKGKMYPIDFNLVISNSDFFFHNQKKYEKIDDIPLEFPIDIPDLAIENFVLCCQNKKFQISDSIIFPLNYLSHFFNVENLTRITDKYISNNHGKLLFKSILFKQENQNRGQIDISNEEDTIALHFNEYIDNEQLFTLPITNIYRIVSKVSKNSKKVVTESQMINFLFKCLDKYSRSASALFIDFDFYGRSDVIQKLIDNYSKIFDFEYLNSKTTFQLLSKTLKEKKELNDEKDRIQRENVKLKMENEQLINQMIKINDELRKTEIKYLLQVDKIEEAKKLVNFLIPVGQKWERKSLTECSLSVNDKSITVTSSSTNSSDDHHPENLFNGKLEKDGKRWGTEHRIKKAVLVIKFNSPVLAN